VAAIAGFGSRSWFAADSAGSDSGRFGRFRRDLGSGLISLPIRPSPFSQGNVPRPRRPQQTRALATSYRRTFEPRTGQEAAATQFLQKQLLKRPLVSPPWPATPPRRIGEIGDAVVKVLTKQTQRCQSAGCITKVELMLGREVNTCTVRNYLSEWAHDRSRQKFERTGHGRYRLLGSLANRAVSWVHASGKRVGHHRSSCSSFHSPGPVDYQPSPRRPCDSKGTWRSPRNSTWPHEQVDGRTREVSPSQA
jgi:hypothetical protein